MQKEYSVIGCCGIDCGLCPRYYTAGVSKCPGCGGDRFEALHPPCGIKTCCMQKHGLEVCSQCEEYPCSKYKNEKIEKDSFVTHKKIFSNHEKIRSQGIQAFLEQQRERIALLEVMLEDFDGGRGKSYFCLAAALLPAAQLRDALAEADIPGDIKTRERALRAALNKIAEAEGITLKLAE